MKTIVSFGLAMLMLSTIAFAQKSGYVNTQSILQLMPEYKTAQQEIDAASQKWQKELEEKYQKIETLYKKYQSEEVLLPDDIKKQRQDEILDAEREAKEFKQKKFGYDGELYKLQDEKVKPLQEKVYNAVETVAKEKKIDFVFDKAGNTGLLYTNALFDLTDLVIQKLGLQKQ